MGTREGARPTHRIVSGHAFRRAVSSLPLCHPEGASAPEGSPSRWDPRFSLNGSGMERGNEVQNGGDFSRSGSF